MCLPTHEYSISIQNATILYAISLHKGSKDNCNLKRFFAAVIGLEVLAAVTATALLIVRSLLSTQNG